MKQGCNYFKLKAVTRLILCPHLQSLGTCWKTPVIHYHSYILSVNKTLKKKMLWSQISLCVQFVIWNSQGKKNLYGNWMRWQTQIIKRERKWWEYFTAAGGENYAVFHYAKFCNCNFLIPFKEKIPPAATWELLWEPWKSFSYTHICLHLLGVCCRFHAC